MLLTGVAALAAWLFVPASPVRTEGRIDLRAAALLSGWLVCLLLPVSQGRDWGWASPLTVGLLVASAVLCALWVRTELRSDAPLIDMGMMRLPAVWTTNLVSLLFGVGMYAGYAFLPQFLQTPERAGYGFGASVTVSGLLLLPQSLATFAAGLLSGRLAARYGSKHVLVVGAALSALSQFGLSVVHDSLWQVLAATVLGGAAFGLAFAAMSNLVVEAVPRSQTGVASGMNANIRTVGGAIGGAVLGSVVTAGARADGLPVEAGYTNGFAVLAGCSAVAALVALLVPVPRQPEPEQLEDDVRHPELAVVASGTLVSDRAA
jgi:predicted MFS family arabinose efflux permease